MARMNVLLIEDVPTLGDAGEILRVASGYARNYLMPRGYAVLATKGAIKQAEEIRQAGLRKRAQMRASAEAQAHVIQGRRLLFQARAGENDRLYGSVTAGEIAEKLEEAVGFEIDRRRIQLGASLRELGTYEVEIRLMTEVAATFIVGVVREAETWADADARAAAAKALQERRRAEELAARQEEESTETE